MVEREWAFLNCLKSFQIFYYFCSFVWAFLFKYLESWLTILILMTFCLPLRHCTGQFTNHLSIVCKQSSHLNEKMCKFFFCSFSIFYFFKSKANKLKIKKQINIKITKTGSSVYSEWVQRSGIWFIQWLNTPNVNDLV